MYPVLFTKCVEPQKRNKDGLQWIVHRFPIKGGISIRDVLVAEMFQSKNLILKDLLERNALLTSLPLH